MAAQTRLLDSDRAAAAARSVAAPTRSQLTQLLATIAPDSGIVRVRRLAGGLDARMHALLLRDASGGQRHLVLRCYLPRSPESGGARATRLWQTLQALALLDLAAPRPVWLDAEGATFGTAALVMTRVRGRGVLAPRNAERWLRGLAAGLAAVHQAPIERAELGFLPKPMQAADRLLEEAANAQRPSPLGPIATAAIEAARRLRPGLMEEAPVLTHGDYWAGNTLWHRTAMTGIVDWDTAALDPAGADVGYCRMDLSMLCGPPAADRFLEAYEAAAGHAVLNLAFWDLIAAVRALPDPGRWLPGYHDLGRPEITQEQMRDRLARFIEDALLRAR